MPNALPARDTPPSSNANITTWRLHYAARDWFTFLVHGIDPDGKCTCGKPDCGTPGKHPVHKGKDRGATVDPRVIAAECRRHPYANVGLHPGLSGVVCIDIDPRNGGNATLARLEALHGPLNAGVVASTGGGGTHHFFSVTKGGGRPLARGSLGAGIDILHSNAYPVIPPSRHGSGAFYKWQDECDPWEGAWLFGDLPAWIANFDAGRDPTLEITSSDDDWVADIQSELHRFAWTEANIALLRSALKSIPADEREVWFRVGAALHNASSGQQEGRTLWDEWSEGSEDFSGCAEKFDADEQLKVWDGLDDTRNGGVTVGTIFFDAKAGGWIDPRLSDVPETIGDLSGGRAFAAANFGKLMFDSSNGVWLRYDGIRWAGCLDGEDVQAAKATADKQLRECQKSFSREQSEANKKLLGAAQRIHASLPRVKALLESARSEPGMSVRGATTLDQDPYLLCVHNGIVDLRTGTLMRPHPQQFISKQAGAAFNPGARCPEWQKFLTEVFRNIPDVISFVRRLVGYTLTGSVDEEKLVFMHGEGANGKSVFANVLNMLFGEYAATVGTELLAKNTSASEKARYVAKLQGARLVLANEVGQGVTWDDQKVKEVTSRERISARMLYHEAHDFMPTHKLWVRGNHQPTIQDASDGLWRRLLMLPFTRQFRPEEQTPGLERHLFENECEGILAWAIRGYVEYQKEGLSPPPSVAKALQTYRSESDVLGQWIDECCDKSGKMSVGYAFASWRGFNAKLGMTACSRPAFTRRVKARGITMWKSNGQTYFLGLSVPTPNDHFEEDDDL